MVFSRATTHRASLGVMRAETRAISGVMSSKELNKQYEMKQFFARPVTSIGGSRGLKFLIPYFTQRRCYKSCMRNALHMFILSSESLRLT